MSDQPHVVTVTENGIVGVEVDERTQVAGPNPVSRVRPGVLLE